MSHLHAALRNDYLRISLSESYLRANVLNAMHAEFVELLHSEAFSEGVIVDLPSVHRLDAGLVDLLLTWNRITALAGKRFRINGVSGLVSQVHQKMEDQLAGPHHTFTRRPSMRHDVASTFAAQS